MSLVDRVWGRIRSTQRRVRAELGYAGTRLRAHQGHGEVGPGSFVDPSAQVLGWQWVKVGENTIVSEDCWFNINHREPGLGGVQIGNNSFIGRRNFFTCGDSIRLGDFCLTGVNCLFLGAGHEASDPMQPYLLSGVTRGGAITVGTNCWIGASCTILGGVTIGHGSIIGAATLVKGSVPPFSMVVGHPGRVVKRYHPRQRAWLPGDEHTAVEGLPSEEEYQQQLAQYRLSVRDNLIAAGSSLGEL